MLFVNQGILLGYVDLTGVTEEIKSELRDDVNTSNAVNIFFLAVYIIKKLFETKAHQTSSGDLANEEFIGRYTYLPFRKQIRNKMYVNVNYKSQINLSLPLASNLTFSYLGTEF